MKRKTTRLENSLISKGFKLSHKTYTGNKSQAVKEYVYKGVVATKNGNYLRTIVNLNPKRDSFLSIQIDISGNSLIDRYVAEEYLSSINYVEQYVKGSFNDLSDDEVVESIEALENI